MRKTVFAEQEYYHLYARGNDKRVLFHTGKDRARFLFLLLHGQARLPIYNTKRFVDNFSHKQGFGFTKKAENNIIENRDVELIAFAIMPNHFHAIVGEVNKSGISNYMHRVLTGYAMYYNKRYEKSGHVFQGPFGSTHITTNEQLIYTSAYVHLNPIEISAYRKNPISFPWSSYQDYIKENRWGKLLLPDVLISQYKDVGDYRRTVLESGAKEELTRGSASSINGR